MNARPGGILICAIVLTALATVSHIKAADCDRAIFSSGVPDGYTALSNERDLNGKRPDGQCVVFVRFADIARIKGIHWYSVDRNYGYTGDCDFIIVSQEPRRGGPYEVLVSETLTVSSREATGGKIGEDLIYLYEADIDSVKLDPGEYWIGVRAVQDGSGRAFWATAVYDEWEAYWRSDYFGEPDWVPVSNILRTELSFAMCLSGFIGDECATEVIGDTNCDLRVDFADIDCFVAALIGIDEWLDCVGSIECDYTCVGDINGDRTVNFDDIDPFIDCLVNDGCK